MAMVIIIKMILTVKVMMLPVTAVSASAIPQQLRWVLSLMWEVDLASGGENVSEMEKRTCTTNYLRTAATNYLRTGAPSNLHVERKYIRIRN